MNLAQWAAFVATPVSTALIILGIVVVRGTKISEFRQKWIDEQRADLATLMAHGANIASGLSSSADSHAADVLAFDLAANKIRLREKPREPEWTAVLNEIDLIRPKILLPSNAAAAQLNIDVELNYLVAEARQNLKKEWDRVKAGELGYRVLVALASVLTAASMIPIVGAILGYNLGIKDIPTPTQMLMNSGYESPAKSK